MNRTFVSVILGLVLLSAVNGDASQDDCQPNEVFVPCGFCEGTCKMPIVMNCSAVCRPPRCECRAKHGFVRAHDGACIRLSECETYVSPFKMDPRQLLTKPNVILKGKVPDHQPSYISLPGVMMPSQRPEEKKKSKDTKAKSDKANSDDTTEEKIVKEAMKAVVDSDEAPTPERIRHNHDKAKMNQPMKPRQSEDSESIEITKEELEKARVTDKFNKKIKGVTPFPFHSHSEDDSASLADNSKDSTSLSTTTASKNENLENRSNLEPKKSKNENLSSRTQVKQGFASKAQFPLDDSHGQDEQINSSQQSQENKSNLPEVSRGKDFGTFDEGPKSKLQQPTTSTTTMRTSKPGRPLGQDSMDRSEMSMENSRAASGENKGGRTTTTTHSSRFNTAESVDATYETADMPLPPSPTYKARPISARPPAADIHPPSPKPKKKSRSHKKHHEHRNQHALAQPYPESDYILYPPNGYRIYRRRRFLRLKAPPKH
ncbi:unnamed protein product [Bursaphelenchus xylophilus]|uniref:(pine wood nematode) hypothetical protein n=1 Tax=Bursaphelenchus xylophilus TaxID=6326 RepID=A0A1I7RP44_BURXY|nr:unnamed protein product [Bursaphelenchus xylophilus]CAG9124538.1 unnamed protein product [Bursaphelenchus xylophilus]